jgi:hypothetical protein
MSASCRKSGFPAGCNRFLIVQWQYGRKKAQKAQKQNFRACNFNVLQ